MISEDRQRQVATIRLRYGPNFYKKIGATSGGAGKTFRDPVKAKEAATIRWAKAREKRDAAQKPQDN